MEKEIKEIKKYLELAENYFTNYRKFFISKQYTKASEFLWGSVSALANVLSLIKKGRGLGTHREMISFLKEIAWDDKEMLEEIDEAQKLHINFYHFFLDEKRFEEAVCKVEKLVERLKKLVDKDLTNIVKSL